MPMEFWRVTAISALRDLRHGFGPDFFIQPITIDFVLPGHFPTVSGRYPHSKITLSQLLANFGDHEVTTGNLDCAGPLVFSLVPLSFEERKLDLQTLPIFDSVLHRTNCRSMAY